MKNFLEHLGTGTDFSIPIEKSVVPVFAISFQNREKLNAISEILAQALKEHLTLLRMTRFWCFFELVWRPCWVKKMGAHSQKSRARNG